MRKILLSSFLTLGVFAAAVSVQAQTPEAQKSSLVQGEVASVDAANNKIALKTNNGEVSVTIDAKTVYKRVTPENPTDLKSATPAALTDIATGDKVVAVGIISGDKKSLAPTRSVYLMTQADISKKQQTEQQKWASGIVGRVTAINPATNEITIAPRGGMPASQTVTVAVSDKTQYRRYAPNSVKFSDAKTSNLAELKVGDQLRARGEKTPDGIRVTAEEIISGSFKMVAGTITAIDIAKNEITVKEANTNKTVVVEVNNGTLLRRFPPEMAQRLAMAQAMRASGQMPQGMPIGGGNAGNAGGQQPRPANPNGGEQGAGGAGGGGGMRQSGGDVDQMLERLPVLTLTELKVGDAIAASSTSGATPDRVTAIKFVAGIEPFLNPPQIPGQSPRPQAAAPSINIPGLDGIGAP
jgi:predicted RNA-binding protein